MRPNTSSSTPLPTPTVSSEPPVLLPTPPHPKPALALTQVIVAALIGLISLIAFTILRRSMSRLYGGGKGRIKKRPTQKQQNQTTTKNKKKDRTIASETTASSLPSIPNGLFSWIGPTLRISEDQVISEAGMDSFIILSFFKMCLMTVVGFVGLYVLILTPIKSHFEQQQPGEESVIDDKVVILSCFVGVTYLFTFLTLHWMNRTTNKIIKTRQQQSIAELSEEKPIVSRTVMISGIPPELREAKVLTEMLESMLGEGTVSHVAVCREWKRLNILWDQRQAVIRRLEKLWTKYLGGQKRNRQNIDDIRSYFGTRVSEDIAIGQRYRDEEEELSQEENIDGAMEDGDEEPDSGLLPSYSGSLIENPVFGDSTSNPMDTDTTTGTAAQVHRDTSPPKPRPTIKTGPLGLFGTPVDAISHYSTHLQILNRSIAEARTHHYPTTSTAFATFKSEITAQICAQTVLDSHGECLRVKMAPVIRDVNWSNIVLSRNERRWSGYFIGVVIFIVSVGLVYPVSYTAGLLNIATIKKHFPAIGSYLEHHEWVRGLVTVLLPTYLFTLMNVVIPYAYDWLCSKQRFVSREEQTVSAVRMNFFYLFVNLFLVFTVVGVRGNYRDFIQDGTKLATQLSLSLNSLSLFYTDLVILQGIGLFPFKLLILGSLMQFTYHRHTSFTARDLSKLYISPKFVISQHLPQPMLIFIITLIYSAQSLAILLASVIYFSFGYVVYKYQLCYCYATLESTQGKLWALIYRRVIFGLLLTHFVMIGTVVGVDSNTKGYSAMLGLVVLAGVTISWWLVTFEKKQRQLCSVVALRGLAEGRFGQRESVESSSAVNGGVTAGSSSYYQQDLLEDWGSMLPLFNSNPRRSPTPDNTNNKNVNATPSESYAYPYLTVPLDGPWIQLEKQQKRSTGRNGNIIVVMVNEAGDGINRKFLSDVI
ncbi:hypothetical protein WICPIJ_009248 [Wickerhamomyces pijperi]|uniref:DUF221-domain-containing protein n=1 Tax=Wickerhamomyces pijperi TaxID=599730 RepID=A0A9P8PQN3_WICPI|nr:hypothetical protein WICPIJ_009248 [Wickerhamomyces pijperi]